MTKLNQVIDIVAALCCLLLLTPQTFGLITHEWLALFTAALIGVHFFLHLDWCYKTGRSFFKSAGAFGRFNFIITIALLCTFAAVMLSGLGVSRFVLPTFGLYSPEYFVWYPLHAISPKILFALLLVHLAVHAKWIESIGKR